MHRRGSSRSVLVLSLVLAASSTTPACASDLDPRWWEACLGSAGEDPVLVEDTESDLVGMPVDEARARASGPFRTAAEDGECLVVTADLYPGRANAAVEDGRVVAVYVEQQVP